MSWQTSLTIWAVVMFLPIVTAFALMAYHWITKKPNLKQYSNKVMNRSIIIWFFLAILFILDTFVF